MDPYSFLLGLSVMLLSASVVALSVEHSCKNIGIYLDEEDIKLLEGESRRK
ncbi:hypothetical protein DFR27_0626 [Umboniibacter marinipuniceus]|uniref:Uncharacterized protein n=1 Tax=Umboniibacter marinipuniceus TaxID=569599 RepID=A0A3M0ABY1_9GAMM|nr:hypothetical protein DFR27_0626 [Umboniibacter marinipuniceus]